MSRVARFAFLAALGCLLVAPSYADEILFFTNGTTMAIRGHLIKDGMIHVDLGAKASMAFPASAVDRIELSGKPVYTSGTLANQAVAGAPGSTEQDGRASVPPQYMPGGGGARPPATGAASGAPAAAMGGSPVSGRLSSAQNPTGQTAPTGMQRIGNHIEFTPPKLGQPAAGPITGFGKKLATPPPPPAAGSDSGSEPPPPPEIAAPEAPPEVGIPDSDQDDEDSPE